MSVDTESTTKLMELVPDDILGTPHDTSLLRQRLTILLAAEITPVVQTEAWAISCLLSDMLGSAQLLRQILEQSDWGANFELSDKNAVFLNDLIEMQHEVWGNLVMMVRDGEMPEPPTPLTDDIQDKERQIVNARRWWRDVAGSMPSLVNLGLMPAADVVKALPSLVDFEYAKQWLEGPYLLGHTLYMQQTMEHGARQSVYHGALAALADILASAVTTTAESINELKPSGKLKLIERLAIQLAWHKAVLRGFVVAAVNDPKLHLQVELVDDQALLERIQLALRANTVVSSTISWDGSSANPLNVKVRSVSLGELNDALTVSVEKAKGSPFNQTPR